MEIQLSPASPSATYILMILAAVLLATAVVIAYVVWLSARGTLHLGAGGVDLQVPFYGRHIDLNELDLSAAVAVEDVRASPFTPSVRTNGVGLPGYQVGWFRLSNGDSGLVALGAGSKAIAVPVRSGFVLVVGVDAPSEALAALRSAGGG